MTHNESAGARRKEDPRPSSATSVFFRLRQAPILGAAAVLAFGILLTAIVTIQFQHMEHRADMWEFQDSVDSMTSMIEGRLRSYAIVLNATAGLFESSESVTPTEFNDFIRRLELETFYAGVRSIGYIQVAQPNELEELAAHLSQFPQEGYHNLRFELVEGQPQHLIITHLQPESALYNGAIGYDLAGHSRRREAMIRAAQTAATSATPTLPLLPHMDIEQELGVVVYEAVYDGDRVHGFAFAAFSTSAVMEVVLGAFPGLGFEVYDEHEEASGRLLYQVQAADGSGRQLVLTRPLAMAGQTWSIVFRRHAVRESWLAMLPFAGLLVSILFAVIVWRLAQARAAAAQRAEQLRRQREWLAVTLASIGDAVLTTDADGRITYMNDRAQELTGWPFEQAVGHDAGQVFRLADEQTGQALANLVPSVLKLQPDANLLHESVLIRRDDTRVLIDDVGTPIRGNGSRHTKQVMGAVITFRDISQRRANERALEESRARLRFVLESARVGEWELDIASGEACGSHLHDQAFGYQQPMRQWSYQQLLEHVHADDRTEVSECFEKSFSEGVDCDVQCRVIWPDGSVHWIEVHGSVYERESGRPKRMLGLVEDITPRKRVEEDLRRSEERFRNLVTATSSIIWTARGDGAIVDEFASWEAFTGQSPAEYQGHGWLDAVHESDRDRLSAGWAEARQKKTAFQFRYRLKHSNGGYRRVDARGVPILAESGEIREWVGSISDVEDQERVAEALLLAEQKFRWIIDSSTDIAIFTFDQQGKIDSWNSGAERVLGYQEEEIIGKDVHIIFTEEDQAEGRPEEERRNALHGHSAMDERWHVRADGGKFFAAGRVMTLRDDHGHVHGFVKILHDRTKEKHAQEALQRRTDELQASEARFRTMADTAPVLIWMADTSMSYSWFNKPWLEFTGREMQQEIGDGWTEDIHPEDRDRRLAVYHEAFDRRRQFKVKYRLLRRDGEYRWMLDHGIPLFGPAGTFAGYIGSGIDITDMEQARETLERYSSDLERLVNERTEKLRQSNEQLRLSERMASLGTLAAGIGHDLGNLLLPIRIRLDMIEELVPPQERGNVQVIRSSAEYLANLAKGLRYLSIDPERAQDTGGKSDILTWWKETQPLLNNTLPNEVQLEHQFPEQLPPIDVSPSALTQAVFNLVQNSGNALRERRDGRVCVWADLGNNIGGRQQVRIGVTDDGPGMDPEVQRRCLEPFFSTRTREFSTGLGLSLVQGVVQRAHGSLEVHSTPGEGTTIVMTFLSAESGSDTATGSASERLAAVLIDDARIEAFVNSELKAMGYQVDRGATLAGHLHSDALLWVLDFASLSSAMQESDEARLLPEFENIVRECVEEDSKRMIVVLRHPVQWSFAFGELDDRVIRTSDTFKPSELRDALRRAASRIESSPGVPHGHGEVHH